MNIALCHECVIPARGGCETYIADLARRLLDDGHEVHLYACSYDDKGLPTELKYHLLPPVWRPRFLRPWCFGSRCLQALRGQDHDISVGFDKTWGQDILYPQGGLHVATVDCFLREWTQPGMRLVARLGTRMDLAWWSFSLLERRQYLRSARPIIVVNSDMVRGQFQQYYNTPAQDMRVVRAAVHPERFDHSTRSRCRLKWRQRYGFGFQEVLGLFVARNYRLKGLTPLLHAVKCLVARAECLQGRGFRLIVAGNSSFGKYQDLACKLGIANHVCFLGQCDDLPHGFLAADFLVHPTFYDPCSLVVLEALACGLPVITTRFNGACELLHPPRDGYVIDTPHDHEHLAWCMAQLLDPGRRADCAQAAQRAAAS